MKTKILFYFLFLIGCISIFLPFDKDHLIHCDFITTAKQKQELTVSFIAIFENVSFDSLHFKNIMEVILAVLLIAPFIFSAVLFFYKKYTLLLIFNVIPLIFLITIGLLRWFEDLQIGYYLLLLQQMTLFYLIIKIDNYQKKKLVHQV
ncbi:hypothetical protein [Flavobacterium pectinovorum]|uniref:hypothetical protein n=1 Tax=Flavobacterium pectinovorum TaxID=29533 RepID=UPI001FAC00FA|nr:hypothetical protein [Flavobacterium pectinovorum]MCI9844454.1 hypothetical protein [Flavobacterium pectinovorum]